MSWEEKDLASLYSICVLLLLLLLWSAFTIQESGDAVTPRFRFSIRADTALFIFVLDMNHVTTTDCGIIFNITMMMMMMMMMIDDWEEEDVY